MWVIAGCLLGLVVVASLLGFHAGPHVHVAAAALGGVAAAWLVFMAARGDSLPALWVLLSADLVVSAGVGVVAWRGLIRPGPGVVRDPRASLAAADAVAVTDLSPEGVVRVDGEEWSALAVNGPVPAGSRVQVLGRRGVRLEVWGEQPVGETTQTGRRSD